MRGSLQEQDGAGDSSYYADRDQRDQYPTGDVEAVAVGASAGRGADPERKAVRGVGRDGWNSREQQCWERDEAAAAGDGVKSAA